MESKQALSPHIGKRLGRWGTAHFFIADVPQLRGDYQRTGNAFDTIQEAERFAKDHGIELGKVKLIEQGETNGTN